MAEYLGQALRSAVVRIVEFGRIIRRREQELHKTRAEACQKARAEWERAQEQIERIYLAQRRQMKEACRKRIAKIAERYRRAIRAAKDKWKSKHRKARAEAAAALERLEHEYKDASWTIESVYEAARREADERHGGTSSQIGDLRQAIARAHKQIGETLAERNCFLLLEAAEPMLPEVDAGSEPLVELEARAEYHQQLRRMLQEMPLARIAQQTWLAAAIWVLFTGIALALRPESVDLLLWMPLAILVSASIVFLMSLAARSLMRAKMHRLCRWVVGNLERADELVAQARESAERRRREEMEEARRKFEKTLSQAEVRFRKQKRRTRKRAKKLLQRFRAKYEPRIQQFREERAASLAAAKEAYSEQRSAARQERAESLEQAERSYKIALAAAEKRFGEALSELADKWRATVAKFQQRIDGLIQETERRFPSWEVRAKAEEYSPPDDNHSLPVGTFDFSLDAFPNASPQSEALRSLNPAPRSIPALADLSIEGPLLIENVEKNSDVQGFVVAMLLEALTSRPAGMVRLHILDPVGLGEGFAVLAYLSDYDPQLIGGHIATETRDIEQTLAALTQHIEQVHQKLLRNEFANLDEYNAQAGQLTEPYRILVLTSYPQRLSEEAIDRIRTIVSRGRRCGVYAILEGQVRDLLPESADDQDRSDDSVLLTFEQGGIRWRHAILERMPLQPLAAASVELTSRLIHRVGQEAKSRALVEIPFTRLAPDRSAWWSGDSRESLRIPIGMATASVPVVVELGTGTSQHMLIAGETGSGKSNLLHAIAMQLALHYSPQEVELYLVDFKKGVEFKAYARHRLPHAKVIAIESEREFGLSVLKRLDEELKQRGEAFRRCGAHDLAGFRSATGSPVPRICLIVDEFQEFFVEEDNIAQEASLLLDRLVRQGRAFGIHVILGSQTLGGAYSLARSTIDQMAIRIALRCSETDSYLILGKNNTAAQFLSRPGEAIYNDGHGMPERNRVFQVVWLADALRESLLRDLHEAATAAGIECDCVVFEGRAPARIEHNRELLELLRAAPGNAPLRVWVGEPVTIASPVALDFDPVHGSNLVLVGRDRRALLGLESAVAVSVAAWASATRNSAGVTVVSSVGEHLERFRRLKEPAPVEWKSADPLGADALMSAALKEIRRRADASRTEPPIILIVDGLQSFRAWVRREDDFSFARSADNDAMSPADVFEAVLREGAEVGVHVVVSCDSLTNLQRFVDRRLMRCLGRRIVLQMSADDSAVLVDTASAAKLSPYHALLYSADSGRAVKFRPYDLPDEEWLKETFPAAMENVSETRG